MLEALIVTLREGIEAALVVGIIVAFLRREGYQRFFAAVGAGIVAALLLSLGGAVALYHLAVNQEVLEGTLYLVSAIVVSSMLLWMWRHAKAISGEVKGALARIVARPTSRGVWLGLFLFTLLMVFREGIETVVFLSALSLSSGGLLTLLGAALGLAAATVFGVLFVLGSLKVDLQRFFTITGIALAVFVVQLLCNGYHELSEAGLLPASPRTMAIVGPLVKQEFFFVAAVLLLPLLMLLVPGRGAARVAAPAAADNPAQARLERAAERRQRRARILGGGLGIVALFGLGLEMVYGQPAHSRSPATPLVLAADGVHIPLAQLADRHLHRFSVELDGRTVRFIALSTGEADGRIATAFDACEVCGNRGYGEENGTIVCLHCLSGIYPPSIGRSGGCNPIPLAAHVAGPDLVIARGDLEPGAKLFE